jgi:hypothetical protein
MRHLWQGDWLIEGVQDGIACRESTTSVRIRFQAEGAVEAQDTCRREKRAGLRDPSAAGCSVQDFMS